METKLTVSAPDTFARAPLTAGNVARTLDAYGPLYVSEAIRVDAHGVEERAVTITLYPDLARTPFDAFATLRDVYGVRNAWLEYGEPWEWRDSDVYCGSILDHPHAPRYLGGVDKRDKLPHDPRSFAQNDPPRVGAVVLQNGER